MSQFEKLLLRVLRGQSDKDIAFSDLVHLLSQLGFQERIRGDHHIFTREDVPEIINIQPLRTKAKAYQVKQVRDIIVKRQLGGDANE